MLELEDGRRGGRVKLVPHHCASPQGSLTRVSARHHRLSPAVGCAIALLSEHADQYLVEQDTHAGRLRRTH
jgi:hypothetical protein